MKIPVSVIILTFNEELNIENCLKSIADWASEIIIVDSFSSDRTLEIVKKYTLNIVKHSFVNQAEQFNWALDNLKIKNDWIFRLDADEYLTEELKEEISSSLNPFTPRSAGLRFRLGFGEKEISSSPEVNGYYIKRRVYFMNRWIKYGGYYPVWFLRLFRKGKARSEERKMDEHIILSEGQAGKLENDFIDDNKKDLSWWIEKHNNYASREAIERMDCQLEINNHGEKMGGQAARKRWLKDNFYYRLPLFCRAFCYFIYRYFFLLGFLDGREGLIFHFLHAFWYRFLVDAKIYEYRQRAK